MIASDVCFVYEFRSKIKFSEFIFFLFFVSLLEFFCFFVFHHLTGDTSIIGAGTYANDRTCAVSATGKGEEFMRYVAAYDVSGESKEEKKLKGREQNDESSGGEKEEEI